MPIRPENKARYPADCSQISARIRERAQNHCEFCGVRNHDLGGRDETGAWWKALPKGEKLARLDWPNPGEDSACSRFGKIRTLRIVRIVLTVAHLDHNPENCDEANLKALCQRCHNRYDVSMRRRGIVARARAALRTPDMFA